MQAFHVISSQPLRLIILQKRKRKKWRIIHIDNNHQELRHSPTLPGGTDTKIHYSLIPDEINPPKLPYIGARRVQGQWFPACQNPSLRVAFWGSLHGALELRNHRKSWKVVWRQNNYPSHSVLAFMKEEVGAKVNKIAKDHIWVFIHRTLRACLSQGWKLTWLYKVLSWNHFMFDLNKNAVNFHYSSTMRVRGKISIMLFNYAQGKKSDSMSLPHHPCSRDALNIQSKISFILRRQRQHQKGHFWNIWVFNSYFLREQISNFCFGLLPYFVLFIYPDQKIHTWVFVLTWNIHLIRLRQICEYNKLVCVCVTGIW